MGSEQKAGPVDSPSSDAQAREGAETTGPAREQTVNETTANETPETAPAADETAPAAAADAAATPTPSDSTATGQPTDQADAAETDAVLAGEVVAGEAPPDDTSAATESPAEPEAQPLGAELAALRAALDERTSDLQRVTAEYANYRKRVERDRLQVAEQATAQVITALLPVLDDLDRAREHGDLVGAFALVAEQLGSALAKFGLTGFGEVGDAFDPTRHEAVSHQTSAEVTAPTCVTVMRRGYLLGERLLRPALVAVADPESE